MKLRSIIPVILPAALWGFLYLQNGLLKIRKSDLMYSILKKKDYPGYLYMLDNGATTTWEHWNGARSRIHNCYNGIGSWFYQALGGILPDENFPGYRHLIIRSTGTIRHYLGKCFKGDTLWNCFS